MKNRIIRTSREGWILVDISTAKYPDAVMYIDKEDWDYIQSLGYGRVYAYEGSSTIYPSCNQYLGSGKRKPHSIHKLLFPNSADVDHENHNGCDNRRSNLRPCTRSQNQMNRKINSNNTSGVKGVCFIKQTGKWRPQLSVKGKAKNLGDYLTIGEAAEVRRLAVEKYHGEFAY